MVNLEKPENVYQNSEIEAAKMAPILLWNNSCNPVPDKPCV